MRRQIDKANTLIEALPYIRAFSGKSLVIKYGGKAMVDRELKEQFAADVVLMKYVGVNPVVVHGGGPQISLMMKRLGKEPTFVEGVRVTDAETMEIVEMVLGGVINKEIVALIHRQGGRAVGITGKDGRLITARPLKSIGPHRESASARGLGLVGEVELIDPQVLASLEEARFIPVIAPVGVGKDGKTYNINADSVAGAIAASLKAEKLLILTDVSGILDDQNKLLPTLSRKDLSRLIKRGVIQEGMLPKVQACLTALEGGVSKTHIIDGRTRHALLLEIFTDKGIGTEIVA
ncbi:MAG TPA: acetylglutamate kinase [Nitrospiria bacterium]|nr:acetylglutamate kinase [Nitrospiria bacterium]